MIVVVVGPALESSLLRCSYPTNAHELYTSAVRQLPAKERLQLAALILEDLTRTPETLDLNDAWSAQDEQELTAFALAHATAQYAKDDDLV